MMKRRVAAVLLLVLVSIAASNGLAKHGTSQPTGLASWGYFLGMDRDEGAILGIGAAIECAFFTPIGSIACGLTAVA
jgi:hypothetical protein